MLEASANIVINGGKFTDIAGNYYHEEYTDVAGDYYAISGNLTVEEVDAAIIALRDASVRGATHDSAERPSPPKCQPGTRKSILEGIDKWVNDMRIRMSSTGRRVGGQVLWLHGPAGAGKSAIAQTVSENLYASSKQLVGSFFFSRRTAGHDIAKPFFPTIALQLAVSIPEMRRVIAPAIKKDSLIFDKSLATQVKHLLVEPFLAFLAAATHSQPDPPPSAPPFLVVLDGLDECNDKNSQRTILDCIADVLHQLPLCFVVVSRPELHIKDAFHSGRFASGGILEERSLYQEVDENSLEARQDVRAFIVKEFARIYDSEKHRHFMKSVRKPWPRRDAIKILVNRSGGYFIYIATVVRFVDEEFFSPVDRLDEIIMVAAPGSSPFAELDKLYTQILSTNPNTDLLVRILGAIFIDLPSIEYADKAIRDPKVIERIFDLKKGAVRSALRGMHSLLRVLHDTVESYHASSYDFLFDKDRAGRFFIDSAEHHADIALNISRRHHNLIPAKIYSGWPFHASKASCPSEILAQFKVLRNNHWESLFDEILAQHKVLHKNPFDDKVKSAFLSVAYMSGTAVKWLQVLCPILRELVINIYLSVVGAGRDLTDQMIYLLNRAFRELVIKQDDDDVVIIQGLHYFSPSRMMMEKQRKRPFLT
ncbi:hypothetical protein D9615_010478 [Tricholomella constricta]|uniref:Nephrocystin 3-like N-terminal domain-containing protein n=1 Tax=Tricholomella constricta TaxID=117010 RepID=A0A8H5LRZ2_9AGAR|nr:hypothetical protein D9615_010478 [Tricholomella constricta]